jgi:hypothetical protein
LPLRVYQAVLRALIKALVPDTHSEGLWLGLHRTLLTDGSSFSMPDTPKLQAQFRTARKSEARVRVSGGQHCGDVPRRHRSPAGCSRGSVANPRNGLYRDPSFDPSPRGCLGR